MAENAALSIIVPIYNLENDLPGCIDSILRQTYQDFELILVDDGSTDQSASICRKYEKEDPRIRFFHKDNGGVSSARNLGLEKAHGHYISFVDGDDLIEPDLYERLIDDLLRSGADISCCQLDRISKEGGHIISYQAVSGEHSADEVAAAFFDEGYIKECMYGAYNKVFLAECIDRIRFKPYQYGEDLLFVFEVLGHAKRVYIDDYVGYHYMQRTGSAMKSVFSLNRLDYVKAAREVEKCCERQFPQYAELAHRWVYRHVLITVRQLQQHGMGSSQKRYIAHEKKYLKAHAFYLSKMPRRYRIDYLLVMYFPFLVRGILESKERVFDKKRR